MLQKEKFQVVETKSSCEYLLADQGNFRAEYVGVDDVWERKTCDF